MEDFNITKLFIQVIINVLLISLFLAIFYFTYVKNIENSIFKNNIKYLSNDISSTILLAGPETYSIIKTKIDNINIPNLSKEDEEVTINNNHILTNAINVNVIFVIVVALIVFLIYHYFDNSFNLKTIIIQNCIILCFVGLTEISYLNYFISEYISIDPNKIKLAIINKL